MDAECDKLLIECNSKGHNGTATLTAKFAGQTLAVDLFDPTKATARDKFAAMVCKDRHGIDRKAVDAKLLEIAGDVASKTNGSTWADDANLAEIDVSRIVRPERFVTPEVSGLTVSTMTEVEGRMVARWMAYQCWSDGRRECGPISDTIELPGNKKLWVYPQPSEATPTSLSGWSAKARRDWLKRGEAPDPSDLFAQICKQVTYFIDFPPKHAEGTTATLALWTILTYGYPAWDSVPYLYSGGPIGSGKSRLFDVLSRLVFRPLVSSNLTGPALFRTLHSRGGVLLFDEAERLKQRQSPEVGEILSMLLAGYRRGGRATRLEPVSDNTFKTIEFDVYGPKALACIAGLPPALASRCIPVMMFRAPPGSEKPRRRIDADLATWQGLRDDLHSFALSNGPTWIDLAAASDVCPEMTGRDYELWQPLLALASEIESHGANGLLKLIQDHAMAVIGEGTEDRTPGCEETLLQILAEDVRAGRAPRPGDILGKAQRMESETFKFWSAKGVASRLKSYGFQTNKSKGSKVYGRVTTDDLIRVQTHYEIDLGFSDGEDTAAEEAASIPSYAESPGMAVVEGT